MAPTDIITALATFDTGHQTRQYGIADIKGRTATFSGTGANAWAGGQTGQFLNTYAGQTGNIAYAIQGNILTGPEVLEAMEREWLAGAGRRLDDRLLATLLAGDAAGGDSRGRQGAALLALAPGAGYDACGVLADLRVDDHPDAPRELARIHALATLHFGAPEDVQPLAGALREEVAAHLARLGHTGADPAVALETWMSGANLETRHAPGGIDARVLDELRAAVRGLTGA